jgi:hypothetical protein
MRDPKGCGASSQCCADHASRQQNRQQRYRRSQCAACRLSRQIQETAQDYSGFGLKLQTPIPKYYPALIKKAVEGGDSAVMRALLGLLLPARKDRHVTMDLPAIHSAEDALEASRVVVEAIADGRLTPAEGGELTRAIESQIKLFEVVNLEELLAALEQQRGLN